LEFSQGRFPVGGFLHVERPNPIQISPQQPSRRFFVFAKQYPRLHPTPKLGKQPQSQYPPFAFYKAYSNTPTDLSPPENDRLPVKKEFPTK